MPEQSPYGQRWGLTKEDLAAEDMKVLPPREHVSPAITGLLLATHAENHTAPQRPARPRRPAQPASGAARQSAEARRR
jgi:hypothetical protein